jgi:hypothetical protein
MARDKSLMEKFAETVRDVAKTATEAASTALKPDPPAASKAEDLTAAYVPLAADGLVGDPMMVPPMAQPRPPRKKRMAKRTAGTTTRKGATKSARKPSAKKSTARKSSRAASRKTARKTKPAAKRRVAKSRQR